MQVQFNRYEQPKSFRTRAELQTYAQAQQSNLSDLKASDKAAWDIWGNYYQSRWREIEAKSNSDLNDEQLYAWIRANPTVTPHLNVYRSLLDASRNSGNNAAQRLREFLDPSHGNYALHNLNYQDLDTIIRMSVSANLESQLRKPNTNKMLTDVINEFEFRLQDLLTNDEAELQAQRNSFADTETYFKDALNEYRDKAAENLSKAQSSWLEAYNSFIEQLKTETAVELWESRATNHRTAYQSFKSWAIGVGIVGGLAAIGWIYGGLELASWLFDRDQTARIAAYAASSVVLFTLYLWTMRVIVRSMISQGHLATDASVRSAMAHTYLALSKDQAATEDDRKIVLASLFAPVSDGLVKDDGLPLISPAALASAALARGQH